MSYRLVAGLMLILAIAGTFFIILRNSPSPKVTASLSSLSTAPAPWPVETNHLPDRMKAIGLSLLGAEGSAQHIHAHLDIFIHDRRETVPADIGISSQDTISPVHTHDETGVIHVESPDKNAAYTLGQFFDIWGIKFTETSIGSYANDATNKLTVYDNGKIIQNPANLTLAAHHEIVVTYGANSEQPSIPSSYKFADGL